MGPLSEQKGGETQPPPHRSLHTPLLPPCQLWPFQPVVQHLLKVIALLMPGPPSGPGQVPDTNGFQHSLNLFKWLSSGRSLRWGVRSSPVKRPADRWAVKLHNRVEQT
ncbi:hypothetical protein AOLI_G00157760 [Acnodon oligacanthus]